MTLCGNFHFFFNYNTCDKSICWHFPFHSELLALTTAVNISTTTKPKTRGPKLNIFLFQREVKQRMWKKKIIQTSGYFEAFTTHYPRSINAVRTDAMAMNPVFICITVFYATMYECVCEYMDLLYWTRQYLCCTISKLCLRGHLFTY